MNVKFFELGCLDAGGGRAWQDWHEFGLEIGLMIFFEVKARSDVG